MLKLWRGMGRGVVRQSRSRRPCPEHPSEVDGLGRAGCASPDVAGRRCFRGSLLTVALFLHVHALKRMRQRGISRQEIVEALQFHETTYRSLNKGNAEVCMVILGKTAAGRPLKVWVEEDDHEAILTVAVRDEEA